MSSKSIRAEIKIIVIGNSGSGKTSFCYRWVKNTFSANYKATVMTDFSYRIFKYNNFDYKVQIWDIGGQDNSVGIIKMLSKDAHGCLLFSDITNINSLYE